MARVTRSSAAGPRTAAKSEKEPQQLSSPPSTPAVAKKQTKKKSSSQPKSESTRAIKAEPDATPATPRNKKKRTRLSIKEEDNDSADLPHNLSTALPTPGEEFADADEKPPSRKRAKLSPDVKEELDSPVSEKKKKTPSKNNYGLTPGLSPYPDYPHPTPDECREVVRVLEKVHGKVNVPKAIPPPSLEVAGCGEVPSVLDALIRTRLSANTTNKNSSTAFQGLVSRFGTLKSGIGKGSVDWDAVRRAPQREVFKAIERGGLADRKSKDIQAILQIAYDEGQSRKAALADPAATDPAGAAHEPADEKRDEIARADQHVLSLDHLHLLPTPDAIATMLTYPGIGPKTASCVALFCMQRPSFAVDTHVFRLCQYLGWVPKTVRKGQPKVDRNTTYSHCDVRIPDEYKYKLHYLLIRHGKTCPRCRAITGQNSAGWDEGCAIEHLVKRHGAKKGGVSVAQRKKAKAAAAVAGEDAEAQAEESADESEYAD